MMRGPGAHNQPQTKQNDTLNQGETRDANTAGAVD